MSDTHFDSVTTLPADLVTTGMQVNKFSGHYVELSRDPKWFDWDAFDAAVDRYDGSDFVTIDDDAYRKALPGVQFQTNVFPKGNAVRISSRTSPGAKKPKPAQDVTAQDEDDVVFEVCQEILDWIVDALCNQLDIQVDENELRANVYSTFTNLKRTSENGFANFYSSSSGTNSSWEYRTVYAYRQPGESDKFFSMVTTIQLEADVESESWWWGLVGSTTATFEATITAEKFGVTKGFKDPA